MKVHHELITVLDGKYFVEQREEKFDSLEALVKFYVKIGYIIRPLKNKMKHKKDAETRGKRSLAKRIFCFFCTEYHGQVHFCHRTQVWRNVDTSLFMEIIGNTRESVERPPGYAVDSMGAQIQIYKSRWDLFSDLQMRSNRMTPLRLRKTCREDQTS